MASFLVLPLVVRRSSKRRAGGWLLAWVSAMRCMAALSWRLPARLSRCRWVLLDQTGSGGGAVVAGVCVPGAEPADACGLADDLGCCERAHAVH